MILSSGQPSTSKQFQDALIPTFNVPRAVWPPVAQFHVSQCLPRRFHHQLLNLSRLQPHPNSIHSFNPLGAAELCAPRDYLFLCLLLLLRHAVLALLGISHTSAARAPFAID